MWRSAFSSRPIPVHVLKGGVRKQKPMGYGHRPLIAQDLNISSATGGLELSDLPLIRNPRDRLRQSQKQKQREENNYEVIQPNVEPLSHGRVNSPKIVLRSHID